MFKKKLAQKVLNKFKENPETGFSKIKNSEIP